MKKEKIFIVASLSTIILGGVASLGYSSPSYASQEQQSKFNTSNDKLLNVNHLSSSSRKGNENLKQYSSKEIEYARVWLQLGSNQHIDELNVQRIKAGTPLNPDDYTSAKYPEDVIQLTGSRLVDWVVTYSGNGNGTINVYNVPLRWDGIYPAGENFYADIIKNKKLVSVKMGDDKKIIKLIKLLNIYD